MHELSIAQSLMDILDEEARTHKMVRIRKIRLTVGELAAVVPESLTFCFELVSRDTLADGAVLEIETVPIVARCERCEHSFEVKDHAYICPRCSEPVFEILSGRELSISNIEGETGD